MSRLSIHRDARSELREAVLYYRDGAVESVALEFVEIYEAALADILSSPRSSPVILAEFRRKVLHKFPYSLYYTLIGSEVRLLAVAHQKREPFYWQGRT